VRALRSLGGTIARSRSRSLPVSWVCRSKTRFRAVTWRFAAGSSPRLGPSRGDAVAALPVGAVLPRRACGAGSI
jgi:hypothetical protein